MGSEVVICRTDWSRTGERETGEEKRIGGFREATRVKLKAADIMVILRVGLGAAEKTRSGQFPGRRRFREGEDEQRTCVESNSDASLKPCTFKRNCVHLSLFFDIAFPFGGEEVRYHAACRSFTRVSTS